MNFLWIRVRNRGFHKKWKLNTLFHSLLQYISRQVQKNRPWPPNDRHFNSLLNMIRNILCSCNANTVLCVGFHKVYLINLLKCLPRCLIQVIGATNQNHRPAIHPCI